MSEDLVLNQSRNLINKYNQLLESYGICVTVKRRYHEEEVMPYQDGQSAGIINILEYYLVSRRREKKYGKMPNRYYYLILKIQPLKKGVIPANECKQYAFLRKQIVRAHQGQEPIELTVHEARVLKRLEKCLQKLLKQAKKHTKKLWYQNNFSDCIRYTFMPRYNYLEIYCGKERSFWDILLSVAIGVLCILFVVVAYIVFG